MLKKAIVSAVLGAALAVAPLAASAESPFGGAKRVTLNQNQMKKVTGQGAIADGYGYRGYVALLNAETFAYYALYTYNSFYYEDYYYWLAYKQANKARNQLYKAWQWAGF
jgi:hypothetical protein